MIAQVSGISQAVAEIAAGAEDQAHGLAEIDVAVREMDEATQQNASMAEKSMAASQKLAQETSKLAGLVQQFKLGEPREPNALAPISQGAARAAA
jgi:methyl-accepting chemotaxis protein